MPSTLPEPGQIVIVRRRPFVVNDIQTSTLPLPATVQDQSSRQHLLWSTGRLSAGSTTPSTALEVTRIGHALRRAEDLPSDVAAAIEAEAGCC